MLDLEFWNDKSVYAGFDIVTAVKKCVVIWRRWISSKYFISQILHNLSVPF